MVVITRKLIYMAKKTKAIPLVESDRQVKMSNALVRAAQSLTLSEKRLLMLGISKLDPTNPHLPQNMLVKVSATEFAQEFGVSMDTAYDELKSSGKQLFTRYISFQWDDGKSLTQMHWVGRATYKDKEGFIELAFWHELAPQLFELNVLFTSYRLSRASALRSIYSWRLFELLMQFKTTGWLKIPIEQFCHAVEAPSSLRNNFANLRIKVIEPALKEIKEKDGLDVTWHPIKAGRKVTQLEFKFPLEAQVALPLKKPNTKAKRLSENTVSPAAMDQREAKVVVESLKRLADLAGVPLEALLKG